MKELIALDIDGTLTSSLHTVPREVEVYLRDLAEKGTQVVLITGRCFSLAYPPLANWKFPYFLALHNGAIILQMPEKKIVSKLYIDPTVIASLEDIVDKEKTDFGLYTGIENHDICYYRPSYFSPDLLDYVSKRAKLCKENWIAVDSFDDHFLNSLTAIKFFGDRQSSLRIQKKVEERLSLHIPVIRDPVDQTVFIAQATHPEVDKGSVIERIVDGNNPFIIAAGDDCNDLPMLKKAHVKIVMPSAPSDLKEMADVVARPVEEYGIIEALKYARNYRI